MSNKEDSFSSTKGEESPPVEDVNNNTTNTNAHNHVHNPHQDNNTNGQSTLNTPLSAFKKRSKGKRSSSVSFTEPSDKEESSASTYNSTPSNTNSSYSNLTRSTSSTSSSTSGAVANNTNTSPPPNNNVNRALPLTRSISSESDKLKSFDRTSNYSAAFLDDDVIVAALGAEMASEQGLPLSDSESMFDPNILESTSLLSINNGSNDPITPKASKFQIWKATMRQTLQQNRSIVLWCIGCIFFNTMMIYSLKQSTNRIPKYPYFLLWFTSIPLVFLFSLYLAFIWLFTNQITPQMRQISQVKFFWVGLLTTLNGFLMLFASPHVPGVLQALIGPSVSMIPLSMLCSAIMLRRKYNLVQVGSVLVILIGLFVAFFPSLHDSNSDNSIWWNLIFFIASIPIAFATVYQEKAFQEQKIHLSYMLFWCSVYQCMTILLGFPVDFIPKFGRAESMDDFWKDQKHAFQCFVNNPEPDCKDCDCPLLSLFLVLFVLSYVLSSIFALGVVKYGNATFSFIVVTLCIPLSEFVFNMKFLMGKYVEPMRIWNLVSLVILCLGVLPYRFFDQVPIKDKQTRGGLMMNSPTDSIYVSAVPTYLAFQSQVIAGNDKPVVGNNEVHWTFP